jgi:hypothetical protein
MPGNGRLPQVERLVKVADAHFPIFRKQIQKPQAHRVGKRLEHPRRIE